MPCAITEPGNYPDYLKTILKKIAVGNNTDLKTCACSLRTPVDNEGCPIIGEDGKIGAFPSCIIPFETGHFSLKQTMEMYWKIKSWNFSSSGTFINILNEQKSWSYSYSLYPFLDDNTKVEKQEQLVCGANFRSSYNFARPGGGMYRLFLKQNDNDNLYDSFYAILDGTVFTQKTYGPRSVYPDIPLSSNETITNINILGVSVPFVQRAEGRILTHTNTLTPSAYWS